MKSILGTIKSKVPITTWINNLLGAQLGSVLLLCGLSLISIHQVLAPSLPKELKGFSLIFLVIGFAIFLFGARIIQSGKTPPQLERIIEKAANWLSVKQAQIVYLLVGLLFAMVATLAAGDAVEMRNLPLAVTAWLIGILLVMLGAWHGEGNQRENWGQSIGWMLLFFVVGLLARGIDLGNIPSILTGDESSGGLSAIDFISDRMNNIFVIGWYDFPSLYFYIQSVSISLFGQTAAALRVPAALVGGLTVSAMYLMARVFYGHLTGILAATFLAGFHFHIHFSRLGLNNIYDGLFYVLVWGALWYGWQNRNRNAFVIAGIALGFSQYFYVSSRALFGLIPAWVLVVSLFDKQRLKDNAVNLLLMLVTALIVYMPLAWFFNIHRDQFQAPLGRFSIFGDWLKNNAETRNLSTSELILDQFKLSIQGFTTIPITQWYRPGVPILRPLPAGAFMIGLTLLILKWKDTRTLLIAIWLAAFVFIGALSTPVPAAQRYIAAAPVIALVVGFSLAEISKLLTKVWEQRTRVISAAVVGIVILFAVDDARFYYRDFSQKSLFSDANTWVAQALAVNLQDKEGDWKVAFFGQPRMGYHSIATLAYLAPHIEGINMLNPFISGDNPVIESEKIIFVFLPGNEDNLSAVQARYPGGQLSEEYYRNGDLLFWMYEVDLGGS